MSYKGQYFVRSGSTTQELKGAALDRFLLKKQGNHWDNVPVPHVPISDLDTKVIQRFRERAVKSQRLSEELVADDDKTLIDKLKLIENNYLKRAALLLFHPDPERFITGAFIKIGFFETNADLLFQNNIHGDLFTQVTQTMDFLLTKYLKAYISYEGIQRIETFPVPEAALREAVLNAITHKDYSNTSPIQISVYKDKLMIWNPGVLPNKWTIEKLLSKHASQPYNPKVANVFFLAGMIESWGRGIEKIIEACATAGSPTPEFKDDGTGLWTTFFFDSKAEIGDNMGDRIGNNVGDGIGDRIGSNIGDSTSILFSPKLNETQREILNFIKRNPNISTSDIAAQIGISKRNIEVNISKLKELGLLIRIGPAKGGHWKVLGDEIGDNVDDVIGDRIGDVIGDSNSVLFSPKLNKTQQKILSFIKRNPNISTSDIAVQIGISKRNIEVNIFKLKELGLLIRIGPAKSGHWKVLGDS